MQEEVKELKKETRKLEAESRKVKRESLYLKKETRNVKKETRELKVQFGSMCLSHSPRATQASVETAVVKAIDKVPYWKNGRKFMTQKRVYNCTRSCRL